MKTIIAVSGKWTAEGEEVHPPTAQELADYIGKMTNREIENLARALRTKHRRKARVLASELTEDTY